MKPYNLLFRNVSKFSQQDIIKDLEHIIGYPIKLNAEHIYTISHENELEIFYYDRVKNSAGLISNPLDIKKILFSNISPTIKTLYMYQNDEFYDHVLDNFDEIKVVGFDLPPKLKKRNNVTIDFFNRLCYYNYKKSPFI